MTAVVVSLCRRSPQRDPSLPHQIVLNFTPGAKVQEIAVSCNCRKKPKGGGYYPLASRPRWDDPREPMRIWREHMAGRHGRGGAAVSAAGNQRDPGHKIPGVRSPSLADPRRLGLPASRDYVYQGTGSEMRPEDAAAYVRLRSLRRYAIAEDAPLADSLMAPPEVHRERTDEEERAALATSRAARAAVPAPTVIRLQVEPAEPLALPAGAETGAPGRSRHRLSRERCKRCQYLTTRCSCPKGPRGGAR